MRLSIEVARPCVGVWRGFWFNVALRWRMNTFIMLCLNFDCLAHFLRFSCSLYIQFLFAWCVHWKMWLLVSRSFLQVMHCVDGCVRGVKRCCLEFVGIHLCIWLEIAIWCVCVRLWKALECTPQSIYWKVCWLHLFLWRRYSICGCVCISLHIWFLRLFVLIVPLEEKYILELDGMS